MQLRDMCDALSPQSGRRWLLGLAGLAMLFGVVTGTERVFRGSSEFMGFRQIVQVSVAQDLNHYEHISHIRAYPPFFAIAWSPFGLFPLGQVSEGEGLMASGTVWQALQLGLSAVSLLVLMTLMTVWSSRSIMGACGCPAAGEPPQCAPILLWVLSAGLMLNSVVRCETDMFVLMLVAGAMYLLLARRMPWEGGFLLGVAAAFKLTPALFGLYLLCRRKWRALGGMIVGGIVCTVVLPVLVWGIDGAVDRHQKWVEVVLMPYAQEGPGTFIERAYRDINQSPKAALVRYLRHYNAGKSSHPRYVNVVELPWRVVFRIATAVKVVILALLLAAWLLPPVRSPVQMESLLFALVPLGMLLLSDVSIGGHMAILAVPLGALIAFSFEYADEHMGRLAGWAAVCGALLSHLIAVPWLKYRSVGTGGMLWLFAATLLVALWLHRRLRSRQVAAALA